MKALRRFESLIVASVCLALPGFAQKGGLSWVAEEIEDPPFRAGMLNLEDDLVNSLEYEFGQVGKPEFRIHGSAGGASFAARASHGARFPRYAAVPIEVEIMFEDAQASLGPGTIAKVVSDVLRLAMSSSSGPALLKLGNRTISGTVEIQVAVATTSSGFSFTAVKELARPLRWNRKTGSLPLRNRGASGALQTLNDAIQVLQVARRDRLGAMPRVAKLNDSGRRLAAKPGHLGKVDGKIVGKVDSKIVRPADQLDARFQGGAQDPSSGSADATARALPHARKL